MRILRYFIDFLFPKSPHIRALESLDQATCIARLTEHPEKQEPPLDRIQSLLPYRYDLVHDVVHEIKYAANNILASKIAPALIQLCPQDSLITFVPVTESRKEKRGFDQGLLIINAMKAYAPNYTYERNLLMWNKKVTQQSLTENREARMRNMDHALICKDTEKVRDKTVVVLDDVCTTGATLYEAERALLEAGAAKVVLLTIAH